MGYKYIDIEHLIEISGGNQQLVLDLVNAFIKQVSFFSAQLDIVYSNSDYLSLGKLAHKIKGSALTLGVITIAENMKELEMLAKNGVETQRYPVLIEQFKTLSGETIEELNDFINALNPK